MLAEDFIYRHSAWSMGNFAIYNEYDPLRSVVLCEPAILDQYEPINDVHRHFFQTDPPDSSQIKEEYQRFIDILRKFHVECHFLDPSSENPYQVYTRDIGFTVGDRFFYGNMVRPVRQPEVTTIKQWMAGRGFSGEQIPHGYVEGGDRLINAPYVYAGLGQRTDTVGADALSALLGKDWSVIPIRLAGEILHLDCVFTIIAPDTILWCPEMIATQHPVIKKHFPDRIEVTKEEVIHMGTNVLLLDRKNILVEARHARIQDELSKRGFTPHPVAWSQLKKFGGLFRCASCPLTRKAQ